MNTVGELNKKVSYRIAKVIYFGIYLVILAVVGTVIYENSTEYPYNENKTHIVCAGSYSGVDILKSRYGISGNRLTLDQKKEIVVNICGKDATNIDSFEIFENRNSLLSKNNYFTASQGVMEEKFSIWYFIKYLFLAIIALSVVFEVVRRIFYYIIFGVFVPKK